MLSADNAQLALAWLEFIAVERTLAILGDGGAAIEDVERLASLYARQNHEKLGAMHLILTRYATRMDSLWHDLSVRYGRDEIFRA